MFIDPFEPFCLNFLHLWSIGGPLAWFIIGWVLVFRSVIRNLYALYYVLLLVVLVSHFSLLGLVEFWFNSFSKSGFVPSPPPLGWSRSFWVLYDFISLVYMLWLFKLPQNFAFSYIIVFEVFEKRRTYFILWHLVSFSCFIFKFFFSNKNSKIIKRSLIFLTLTYNSLASIIKKKRSLVLSSCNLFWKLIYASFCFSYQVHNTIQVSHHYLLTKKSL